MILFLASLALFIALHSLPALPAVRSRLIARLGRGPYLAAYSLVSVLALLFVFSAAYGLDYIPLWDPAPWQARVTILTAPLGLFLVIAGLLGGNPLSISLRPEGTPPGAITAISRHPVLIGFLLWAGGHLFPNGDLRSVILFGLFALFSLGGIAMQEKRARRRLGTRFESLAAGTSILPLGALLSGRARLSLDAPLLVAALLAALLTLLLLAGGHEALIGVDPLALATAG